MVECWAYFFGNRIPNGGLAFGNSVLGPSNLFSVLAVSPAYLFGVLAMYASARIKYLALTGRSGKSASIGNVMTNRGHKKSS